MIKKGRGRDRRKRKRKGFGKRGKLLASGIAVVGGLAALNKGRNTLKRRKLNKKLSKLRVKHKDNISRIISSKKAIEKATLPKTKAIFRDEITDLKLENKIILDTHKKIRKNQK